MRLEDQIGGVLDYIIANAPDPKHRPLIRGIKSDLVEVAVSSGLQRIDLYGPDIPDIMAPLSSFSINDGLLVARWQVKEVGIYVFLHELYHQFQVHGTKPQGVWITDSPIMSPDEIWDALFVAQDPKKVQRMEIDAEAWANAQSTRLTGGQIGPIDYYSRVPLHVFCDIQQILNDLLDQPRFEGDRNDRDAVATHLYRAMAMRDPKFPIWW